MTLMCVIRLLDILFAGIFFIQLMKRRWQLDLSWQLFRAATFCCHLLQCTTVPKGLSQFEIVT